MIFTVLKFEKYTFRCDKKIEYQVSGPIMRANSMIQPLGNNYAIW